jgi:hypothetical protein
LSVFLFIVFLKRSFVRNSVANPDSRGDTSPSLLERFFVYSIFKAELCQEQRS